MPAKTFAQLYTDALIQADETAGSGSATAKTIIKNGINESYAEIASLRDWETLKNSTTITTVAGTAEYTPITSSGGVCRIRAIESVLDETNKRYVQEIRREVFEKTYPFVAPTDTGVPLLWYVSTFSSPWFRDLNIKLYPIPNATTTVRIWYFEDPLELQSDDTIPRIPDQYHYGLAYLGLAKYFEYQKDAMASYYRGLHEQFKAKILDNETLVTEENPSFQLQSPSNPVIIGKVGRVYN